MKNRSIHKRLIAGFALLTIIGLCSNALAESDYAPRPQYTPQLKIDTSLMVGGDRVPMAMMFTATGTSWEAARNKALKAASIYYRFGPYKVVSERREFIRLFFVRERYQVTIWTVRCF